MKHPFNYMIYRICGEKYHYVGFTRGFMLIFEFISEAIKNRKAKSHFTNFFNITQNLHETNSNAV